MPSGVRCKRYVKRKKMSTTTAPRGRSSSSIEHEKSAERFVAFCDSLNRITEIYKRTVPTNQSQDAYPPEADEYSYVSVHLDFIVYKGCRVQGNRHCLLSPLVDGAKDGNPRITIPSTIIRAMRVGNCLWCNAVTPKVSATWIVCWLEDISPDQHKQDWQTFEVSHRCRNNKCIEPDHLCWESKSVNQSRGNDFCRRMCLHDECEHENVCSCQRFHSPHCL